MVSRGSPNITHQYDSPLSSFRIFSNMYLRKKEKKTPKAMNNWFNAPNVPDISLGEISFIMTGMIAL